MSAAASGGLFGTGPEDAWLKYVGAANTDLVFGVVGEEFGFPVYSVVDVYDIIEYLEEDPANAENVARIKNYLSVNGAVK